MPNSVITDTSVLIIFDKIDRLDILEKVYQEIYTTPEIASEYGKAFPAWIRIETVKDKRYQKFIEAQLDRGESSVIALALEKDNSLLIIDDLKARKFAKKLGLNITGALGVINKAKELGIIDKIKPVIDKLKMTDFRVGENVFDNLLNRNNE